MGERLDRVAPGRYLLKWTLFVRFALFWDFFDLSMAGVLLGLWLHSGASSAGLNAAFISETALGMLVGNIAAAAFLHRLGRKTKHLWAFSPAAVSSLLSDILPFSLAEPVSLRFFL